MMKLCPLCGGKMVVEPILVKNCSINCLYYVLYLVLVLTDAWYAAILAILSASWLAWARSGVSKGLPVWPGDPGAVL